MDILKKLGMEEVWICEYTGRIGEWRRRCAEKIDQSERAGWRRDVEKNPERRGFARCARMVSKMRFILLRDAMRIKSRGELCKRD